MTRREERAVRVQARGPHEGEPRLAGSCGARRFRGLPDALASAAERAVACGQFDDLGFVCVPHYVAEAPQEFEALPDGPQEHEHKMATGQTASHKVGISTNSVCFACRTMLRKRPRSSRRCPMDRKWAG